MNSNNKVVILSIIIVLITIVTGISLSYAYWASVHVSSNSNILNSGCLNVEFKNLTNDISVSRAYPGYTNYTYTDEYLDASGNMDYYDYSNTDNSYYYFTITNTCTTVASYDVNLETLEGSNLNSDYLDLNIYGYNIGDIVLNNEVDLDRYFYYIHGSGADSEKVLIDKELLLSDLSNADVTLNNAIYSNNIYSGVLGGRESHVFGLSIKLKDDADIESQEKTWNSKIVVNSKAIDTTNLIKVYLDTGIEGDSLRYITVEPGGKYGSLPEVVRNGYVLEYWYMDNDENKKVTSETIVHDNKSHTINAKMGEGTLLKTDSFWRINRDIKYNTDYVEYYDSVPDQETLDNAILISEYGYTKAYTWLDDNILYYYSEAPYLYFNEHDGFGGGLSEMSNNYIKYWSLKNVDLSKFKTNRMTNMSEFFAGADDLLSVDLSNFDTSNVTDMHGMFGECSSLTILDVSNFDTSNVTNMSSMFYDCYNLISLNVSNFNTSSVVDMWGMFSWCANLESIDVSNFDTSNVESMSDMFNKLKKISSLDISNFDTSKVKEMSFMFAGLESLTEIDLSTLDTSNVTNMSGMFKESTGFTSLDLSNFDTSNVQYMDWMFEDCSSLVSINLSSFNTSNVTLMPEIFKGCTSLETLDLSSFDTSLLNFNAWYSTQNMFYNTPNLKSVVLDCENASNLKDNIESKYTHISVSCA